MRRSEEERWRWSVSMSEGKKLPSLVLGTMTIGEQVDEPEADRLIGMFLTSGGREIDTAYYYGEGATEVILGRLLAPARRQQIYLATKANPWGEGGLRPRSVRRQLEASLQRLRTDSVDLFYLHAPDLKTPIETTLETCDALFREGKFRELGLSNYASWQVVDAWHICKRNGWVFPTAYQGMYNAVTRAVEPELFPALRALGMRFYAYNPLAGGLLTGKHRSKDQVPTAGRFALMSSYRDRYWKASYFAAVDRLREACEGKKMDMVEGALRWEMFHSQLSGAHNDAVIMGASSAEQMAFNLKSAVKGRLPLELLPPYDRAWELVRSDCPEYFRD
jgi:aflatoxin B1 aldehyde reductase